MGISSFVMAATVAEIPCDVVVLGLPGDLPRHCRRSCRAPGSFADRDRLLPELHRGEVKDLGRLGEVGADALPEPGELVSLGEGDVFLDGPPFDEQ